MFANFPIQNIFQVQHMVCNINQNVNSIYYQPESNLPVVKAQKQAVPDEKVSTRLQLDVNLQAPTVIVPTNSFSMEYIMAKLGTIKVIVVVFTF